MANTRKPQPRKRSRRQKQPATIDLEANPPEEAEKEIKAQSVSGDDPKKDPKVDSRSADVSVPAEEPAKEKPAKDEMTEGASTAEDPGDAGLPEGSETTETPHKDKRSGAGSLIQAGIAAVVGGGIALGGANLMGKLGAPTLPGGADPAALAQSQEEIQSLKAQLNALQQRVADGVPQTGETLPARIEALEAASGSGGDFSGELQAARSAADTALQRSEELETRLEDINAALLEGGAGDGEGAAAALSGIDQRLAALESEAGKLSADLESRLEQLAAQMPGGEEIEAAIDANRQEIAALKTGLTAVTAQINEKILPAMQQVEAAAQAAVSGQKVARSVSARALSNVLEQGGTFTAELASAEALTGGAPEFDQLRPLADKGIQTPAQLLGGFDETANRILAAENRPQEGAGIVDRFMASAKSLVTVRPAGPVDGDSVGAILSRVEAALAAGDTAKALSQWETLPETARLMGADFEQALRERIEAESLIGSVVGKLSAGQN